MLKLSLNPHPDRSSAVDRIDIFVARAAPHELSLTYCIWGALDRISLPPARIGTRTDGLWKHTCFEAFFGAETGYYELNFSPSSEWAAYRFDAYREGMRDADLASPSIGWRAEEGSAKLTATFRLPPDLTGRIGLSAIIEEGDGYRSFWALAHPAGAPDFHDPACFAAELPPAG